MRLKLGFSLIFACALCIAPAYSAESLRFDQTSTQKEILNMVAQYAPEDAWVSSATDLNNDGIDERILKTDRKHCDRQKGCHYVVTARKGRDWIALGDVQAFNILVSDQRTYGIRDLIVYTLPNNDFSSVRYAWNPKSFKYEEQ